MDFPAFLLLISLSIPLWSEKTVGMLSVLLNELRVVACPMVQSFLEKVPRALEENACSAAVGSRVLIHGTTLPIDW